MVKELINIVRKVKQTSPTPVTTAHAKNGGAEVPPFLFVEAFAENQRRSCRTFCCDWLASASAEVAIDWRVDSAWLLAASSLESASVRLDEPVCSTLIRFLLKSWRICTIDRFEPSEVASVRSVVLAAVSAVNALLAELLSRKSTPWVRVDRPRPLWLKVTPWMLSVDRPVSLNTSFRVSPFNRL